MAIVSLVALLAALALAAVLSLQPWATTTVGPRLTIAPGVGVALGHAEEVATPGPRLEVAAARQVTEQSVLVAGDGGSAVHAPAQTVGISSARPVAQSSPPKTAGPPDPPSPKPLPPPQPVPDSVPVAVPPPEPSPAAPKPSKPGFGNAPHGPSVAGGPGGAILLEEGDVYASSLVFFAWTPPDGVPLPERPIVHVDGEASDRETFGLELRSEGDGKHGLWSTGEAAGEERLLTAVDEGWHEAFVYLRASSEEEGFYLVLLDGEPVDARSGVSLIDVDGGHAEVELGPGVAPLGNPPDYVLP